MPRTHLTWRWRKRKERGVCNLFNVFAQFLPLPASDERGEGRGTAVELRSADFSPPPLGTCKSAGSGMNSALQVRCNWLNSTAVHPCPLPWGAAAQGGYSRRRVVHPSVSSVSALAQFLPEHRRGHNESDRGDDL